MEQTGWRREVRAAAELFAATGFAITQPVLSVFGRSADVFINRDASSLDIVAFAVLIAIVPTVVLWVLELVVGLVNGRAREVLHVGIIGALAALFGLRLLKSTFSLEGVVVVLGALVLGAAFAALYVRVRVARVWLVYASFAPVLFVVLFLVSSSITSLVFPEDVQAAESGPRADAPPVVMITFDEWPTSSFVGADGKVDAEHFPNLAKFAQSASWYRNSTSITTATWYAVPTILTGRYPEDGDIPEASSHPESLFTMLGGSYRLDSSETVTRLCPKSLCTELGGGTGDTGLPSLLRDAASTYRKIVAPNRSTGDVTATFEERTTEEAVAEAAKAKDVGNADLGAATANRPDRFDAFLRSIRRGEEPTLHYLHVLLPHVEYRYLPDGRQYSTPEHEFGKNGDDWSAQPWPAALGNERLLLQAAYTDQLIGDLMDRLRATGLWDRAVVVLAADHGIAFTPGEPVRGMGERPVSEELYPQLLWAPLFVKAPSQTVGETSDANVMTVDVLPTIAKLTGTKIPWKVDGVPAGTRKSPEKVFMKSTVNAFGVALGPQQRFDGSPGLQAMLDRNVDAITSPGDPALQLYRVGPNGALVGRRVDDLSTGSASARRATLEQLEAFRNVDLDAGTVPALVWGSLDGPGTVAVAVNGTIAGVSPTFADENLPNRFAAMVPDSLMRNGRNRIELYELTGPSDAPVLRPIPARSP